MLCCVPRKPWSRSKNHNDNHENDRTSILYPKVSSSSGTSSSIFHSSDNFDFSGTSGLTASLLSSLSDTASGFSSSSKNLPFDNSSKDSPSLPSAFAFNSNENLTFFHVNTNVIRTPEQNSSDIDPSEAPKWLRTFSPFTKRDNITEVSIDIDSTVDQESSTKDEQTELLPCAICARTFKPQSLEKHTRICELAALKKRKPFDSAKQRIQGTELEEFLPKETATAKRKVYQPEEKIPNNKGSWKETHDELLRAVRAARGEPIETNCQRQLVPAANVTIGVPTRPNEKGICPTCNRQFSIKSYERHVAWCKDRATRVPLSAATNIAKERLEARMKYRAPALKIRRLTNREKYSPSSAFNLTNTTSKSNNSPNSLTIRRAKEIASIAKCNDKNANENPTGNTHSQKSTMNARHSGQSREGISSGPMKSRLSDRSNRPSGDNDPGTRSVCPTPRQNSSRISHNSCHHNSRASPTRMNLSKYSAIRTHGKNDENTDAFDETDENLEETSENKKVINRGSMKNRRHPQNIVHARSHGNPRVNDVTINNDVIGMTVQPCVGKKHLDNTGEFLTWKKIGEKSSIDNEFLKFRSIESSKLISVKPEDDNRTDKIDNNSNPVDEKIMEMANISWASGIEKLDQTYLIRESLDGEPDLEDFVGKRKRRPASDSPRIGFYYDEKTMENFFNENIEDGENSSRLHLKKKMEDKRPENGNSDKSPVFSRCLKVEPLNLINVKNSNDSEKSETHRSKKNAISSRKSDRSNSTKNSPQSRRTLNGESPKLRSINLDVCKMENKKNILSRKNKNDINEISNSSRSPKNIESSKNNVEKLSTRNIDSVVPENSIQSESIIVEVCNGEEILDTSRSSKSTETKDNNREKKSTKNIEKSSNTDDVGDKLISDDRLNFNYDEENFEKLFFDDTRVGICDHESLQIIETSKSFIDESCLDRNRADEKIGNAKPIIEIESLSKDSLIYGSNEVKKIDDSTKINFFTEADMKIDKDESGEKIESSTSVKNDVESYDRNYHDNSEKNNCSYKIDSKIDNKSNKNQKNSPLPKKEEKANYQRCGTYVLDGKTKFHINTKHHAPDKFLDEKPVKKRRRTENIATLNDLKNPSNHIESESYTTMEKKLSSEFVTSNCTFSEIQENSEFEKNSVPEGKNSFEKKTNSRQIPEVQTETIKKSKEPLFQKKEAKPELQNSIDIRRKLREKMKLLRGDTNNLITSVETSGDATINENSFVNETIREIDFSKFEKTLDTNADYCGFLPEIPIDRIITNSNCRGEKTFLPNVRSSYSWGKSISNTNAKLINLDPPKFHRETKIPSKRLSTVEILPRVGKFSREKRRISDRDSRAVWSNYVRRRPDFNFVLTGRTGGCADYDPFLIAERQMNDLLSDACSDKSITDCSSSEHRRSSLSPLSPNYHLSHSSAFVKYPDPIKGKISKISEQRVSMIAPPTEFDDFSSDSTETNSISREIDITLNSNLRSSDNRSEVNERRKNSSRDHVFGRKIIIDRSKALGTKDTCADDSRSNDKSRKFREKITTKVTRTNSMRRASDAKAYERKCNNSGSSASDNMNNIRNNRNNINASLNASTVSLSSVVSTDIESVKRSNSLFDEAAMSSCDDDTSGVYPSLKFLLKNDSLSVTSPVQSNRPRNGQQQISDEDFSSPDSYKRHNERNKLGADSAYSSLNRKHSNHGRSTNDMAGRHDEDLPLHRRDVDGTAANARSKMSKFCHECGSKFPETAKFCCECGIRRLAL